MQKDIKEIVLCERCQGAGIIIKEERVSFYDSETVKEVCEKCNGTGRLVRMVTFEEYKIFDKERQVIKSC